MLDVSSAPHLRQDPLEIPADHQFDLIGRVPAAKERLGEGVKPEGMVEAFDRLWLLRADAHTASLECVVRARGGFVPG